MENGLVDFLLNSLKDVGGHPHAESSLHRDTPPDIGPWIFAIVAKTAAGRDFVATNPWILDATFWFIHNYMSRRLNTFPLIKEGDLESLHASVAALRSIVQVLEQLRHPKAFLDLSVEKPTESLRKKVLMSYQDICSDCSVENCSYASHLKDMVRKAADMAESFSNYFTGNRNKFIENASDHLDAIRLPKEEEEEDNLIKVTGFQLRSGVLHLVLNGDFDLASPIKNRFKDVDDEFVGLANDLGKIKDQLLGPVSALEIIPIIGMGGIGKTTMVRRVCKDPQIIHKFHCLAWATISQEFQERDVLLDLLQSIAPLSEEESKKSKEDLAFQLYRRLKGQRFLIVVDDMWTTESWDTMKLWFPDDDNGSRILLTSRLKTVAGHANSWTLLSKKVFAKETCPPELINTGRQLAKECKGLPLAIIVLAGHLSKMDKTADCWESIAKKVCLLMNGTEERIFSILSMSYNDLPQVLRMFFLYMANFPKNSEIPVSKLIRMWIGFWEVNPETELPYSLEFAAEMCLEELISRKMIMVRQRKYDGRVKTCGIHDLLWDLCLTECRREGEDLFGQGFCHDCFDADNDIRYLMGLTHSFLNFYRTSKPEYEHKISYNHLLILDILHVPYDPLPVEITNFVNLRYLALSTSSEIPESISNLQNLETLINYHERPCPVLPKEIWSLSHLRHLHVRYCTYLPNPPSEATEGSTTSFLPDLQTLSTISFASCTKDVFVNIPNLKELGIHEIREECRGDEVLFNCISNLVYLTQLEKLKFCCSVELDRPQQVPPLDNLLPNIKKLTLLGSYIPWEEMNVLAKLPNLEVLKLKENAFKGPKWEQIEEGFPKLKFLLLQYLDLVHWEADSSDHFPNLQFLVLKDCGFLLEIAYVLGEVPTLEFIELDNVNFKALISAKNIEKEQKGNGNEEFILRVCFEIEEIKLFLIYLAFIYMTILFKQQRIEQGRC